MISIGVVGRGLNHENFKTVFSILNDGVESGFWTYNKYPLDNGKTYNGSDDQFLIFIATTPKGEGDKDYIKFTGKPSEEEIADVMQNFIYRICEKNESSQKEEVVEETPKEEVLELKVIDTVMTEDAVDLIIAEPEIKNVEGLSFTYNGKVAYLRFEDVDKLTELMKHMDKFGFKIVDIECT